MTKILIAQPTTGSVLSGTVDFMMHLVTAFQRRGIAWAYRYTAISDIALSRNIFASHVIADNEYTHLLFLDSDMGFTADTILGLLDHEKPVVAAACPKRYLAWEKLNAMASANAARPEGQRLDTGGLIDLALDFNVDLTRFDGSPWTAERDGRFLKVPAVGTAVMLIHRDVFEIMLAREVAVPRPGYTGLPVIGTAPLCDFFSPLEKPDRSMIESEDISFCKRWVEDCDGEIWVDVE
ncbi:MAG: hypothetical protein AAF666_10525, partial [Pseudomonadota bacterium]